jgi:hypothetical protein
VNKVITTAVDITRPPQGNQKVVESSSMTETCLAADGKAVLKEKVVYGVVDSATTEKGTTKTTKSPVSGKTYIVEFKNNALVVTDENYKPVPAAEAAIVKQEEKNLGKPLVQLTSLPDGPIKKGATVDAVAEILRAETVDAKTDVSDLVVTLASVEKDKDGHKVAVFAVSLKIASREPQWTSTVTLKGTLSIRDDSRPVGYVLDGPLTMKGAQVDGAGTWSLNIKSE